MWACALYSWAMYFTNVAEWMQRYVTQWDRVCVRCRTESSGTSSSSIVQWQRLVPCHFSVRRGYDLWGTVSGALTAPSASLHSSGGERVVQVGWAGGCCYFLRLSNGPPDFQDDECLEDELDEEKGDEEDEEDEDDSEVVEDESRVEEVNRFEVSDECWCVCRSRLLAEPRSRRSN